MVKSRLKQGICRLCGETKLLNFEHVPPRSTFNKNTRYVSDSFMDYMKSDNPFEREAKGKVNQGGVGYYAYCEKCNNFLGNEYVRSYKIWAEIGGYIISRGRYDLYHYEVLEQNFNRILKHTLSMFIAMNDVWFREEYSEIIEFIKNVNSTQLTDRYRVFMYFNNGPQIRYVPFMIHGNFTDGIPVKCCELAFPPYGYVFTIDSQKDFSHLTEITEFKLFNPNENANRSMKVMRLETNLPIPFDYRTKEEIQEAIKGSKSN